MTAYYNEIDPYAAQWLRNLIAAGHIAPGVVDERSIEDVSPLDLMDYTQCHFFAGVAVWSYALRQAGWPDDRPVWTGSAPCQPFSAAGKGVGTADKRHLWPHFHHLISQRRPVTVLGEQVEAAIKHGWLDLVQADLEGIGYTFGATGVPAAGVGAPHIRNRLYWVANARRDGHAAPTLGRETSQGEVRSRLLKLEGHFASSILCRDGKVRPCEPGFEPWVDESPGVLGRLRAYGNAINAEAAKAFIECVMECQS